MIVNVDNEEVISFRIDKLVFFCVFVCKLNDLYAELNIICVDVCLQVM